MKILVPSDLIYSKFTEDVGRQGKVGKSIGLTCMVDFSETACGMKTFARLRARERESEAHPAMSACQVDYDTHSSHVLPLSALECSEAAGSSNFTQRARQLARWRNQHNLNLLP